MQIAQAKTIVHCHAQDDCVKVGMFPDHFQVILHGAGLLDGVVNRKNSTGDKLLWVEFVEVVHLPLFVGIHEHEIEKPLELCHLHMGVAFDESYPMRQSRLTHVPPCQVVSFLFDFDRGQPTAGFLQR